MPNDYIDRKLDQFIKVNDGQIIDLTGAYGPQSPDLIAAYIQALLKDEWHFEYPCAADLWDDRRGSMGHDFERVEGQLQRGDIAVFDRTHAGVGTVGAVIGKGDHPGTIKVFTQNPGQARPMNLPTATLLGAWRLTAGAECVALATEYAQHRGLLPDDAEIISQETVKGYPVTTWSPGPSPYGHVETLTAKQARHYRRQTWRHRAALVFGWLRGNR